MSTRSDDRDNPFRQHPADASIPLGANETPVDLAAVQADNALLGRLGRTVACRTPADAELARVLFAWRRDVDSEPFGELLDADTAGTVIKAGIRLRRRSGWRWLFTRLVLTISRRTPAYAAVFASPRDRRCS